MENVVREIVRRKYRRRNVVGRGDCTTGTITVVVMRGGRKGQASTSNGEQTASK